MKSLSGYCLLCHQKTTQKLCCTDCEQDLQPVVNRCQSCGCILPDTLDTVCGQCQVKPPAWRYAKVGFCYDDILKSLVYKLKFARQEQVAQLLTRLFLNRIQLSFMIDYIIPVPLHWQRTWFRGYNQADLLAREIVKTLGCGYAPKLLVRQKRTAPQAKLARKARTSNVSRAFVCKPTLRIQPNAHIVLVDDVMTTGATLKSACQALKKEYPNIKIDVWAICRA